MRMLLIGWGKSSQPALAAIRRTVCRAAAVSSVAVNCVVGGLPNCRVVPLSEGKNSMYEGFVDVLSSIAAASSSRDGGPVIVVERRWIGIRDALVVLVAVGLPVTPVQIDVATTEHDAAPLHAST